METKVVLNIVLKGATRVRRDTPDIIKWEITKKEVSKQYNGKDKNKVVEKGKFKYYDYDIIPAVLHTNLCKEAYEYFTGDEYPSWIHKAKYWKRMNTIQRLETHLDRLCKHHNGVSFTYEILED